MGKKFIAGTTLMGLVAAGGLAATVSAQTVAAETGLTEEQAIAIALEEVPGEVQEVELEKDDGVLVYEISILGADDVEMEVEIAATSGDVLEIEADGDDCGSDRDT